MRILLIAHGGTDYKNLNLLASIADELIIIGYYKHKSNLENSLKKVKAKNLKVYYPRSLLSFFLKPLKIRADLVMANCPISGFSAFISKLNHRKSIFFMCQDFVAYHKTTRRNYFIKSIFTPILHVFTYLACKSSNLTIVLSNFIKDRARKYGARNIQIIPMYGVNTNLFSPKNKDSGLKAKLGLSKNKILFTASRLSSEKGMEYLVKSLILIKKQIPNIKLLIAGTGPDETMLKNLVKKLDLEQNVIFLGKIDYGLLPHYYNLCDIFVLPSIEEGLGFVSAEALACLKPVVASNVGGIPDIIIHNKTGILIERKNPEALSDAIIKLLKDKNLAKRLALNGQSHIKKNFEEERVMEKFKNAIELSLPNIKNYGFNKDLKS